MLGRCMHMGTNALQGHVDGKAILKGNMAALNTIKCVGGPLTQKCHYWFCFQGNFTLGYRAKFLVELIRINAN